MHRTPLAGLRAADSGKRGEPLGRLLSDRVLPGLFFGVTAITSCLTTLRAAYQDLSDPSFSVELVYVLDVAHPLMTSLFCGLVATLFVSRGAPRGSRARPPALAVALAGTFVMGGVAAQPLVTRDWRVLALADVLLVGGLAISIYAAASLRGAFGLAPEARDLVTSGAYRLVRHPLYLGELVAATGALLPALAPLPIVIFAIFCLCQFTRAVLEERVPTAAFPQYVDYRRQTPALVPWPRSKARSARSRVTPAGWPAWSALLPNAASREDEDRALTSRDSVDQESDDDARQQEGAAADQG